MPEAEAPPAEIMKAVNNREWRLDNLYWITDKNKKKVRFVGNQAQKHFRYYAQNRNLILKSRQIGFTTEIEIEGLDDALFTPNFDFLVVAHEKQEALKIFDKKINEPWESLGEEMHKIWNLKTDTKNSLKFGFGTGQGKTAGEDSQAFSSVSVSESGRSGTYHRVHVSEYGKLCAKYPHKASELITGTFQSVPMDGRIDIESTAEGEIGGFHDMFWEAWNRQGGRNFDPATMTKLPTEYAAFFYNWCWDLAEIAKVTQLIDVPEKFKDYQKKYGLTDQQISYYFLKWISVEKKWDRLQQEYPTTPEEAFVSSGQKLFDTIKLKEMKTIEPIQLVGNKAIGYWKIYEKYDPRGRYALGGDVAEGVGGDASSGVIWNFAVNPIKPKPRVVATYYSNTIAPDNFAYRIRDGGNLFGTCLVAPEINNHGHATMAILKTIYPPAKIYQHTRTDKMTRVRTDKLGWYTNLATKPQMFYDFVTAIEQELVELMDKMLLLECRQYGKNELQKIKADPERTQHFDLLTAAVIGFQMKNHAKLGLQPGAQHQQVVGGVAPLMPGIDGQQQGVVGGVGLTVPWR